MIDTLAEIDLKEARDRIFELKAALRPFAEIRPSSFYADDGSEGESYNVTVTGRCGATPCDFTGWDLAEARRAMRDTDR